MLELMKVKDWGDRRWYREQPGADLRRDRGTGRVSHGFAADRAGSRSPTRHCIAGSIPRRFAIAAKEVTVEQYQEFVKENPRTIMPRMIKYSPDPEGPMNNVYLV